MQNRVRAGAGVAAGIWLSLTFGPAAHAQARSPVSGAVHKETVVTTHARGTFDVQLKPQAAYDRDDGTPLGRMSIDKQFHGDLDGASKGEMLSAVTSVKGSAGYVAIERVTGTVNGHRGTFILQHSATMTRGVPLLTITVVPDSGTDQLVGLAGTLAINIVDGKHFYDFEYTLAGTP